MLVLAVAGFLVLVIGAGMVTVTAYVRTEIRKLSAEVQDIQAQIETGNGRPIGVLARQTYELTEQVIKEMAGLRAELGQRTGEVD